MLKYIIRVCIIVISVFWIGTANLFLPGYTEEMLTLTLSDYPELFREEVIIVVRENAAKIEIESAIMIKASLKELTGNEPIIKNDTELSELEKENHNLILIGNPSTNNTLQQVYELTEATKVTSEFPGENKGIIEILRNPWNSDKVLLMVAGSNEWGVKAGSELLEKAQDINKKSVRVESKDLKAVFSPVISINKYVFVEILQQVVIPGQGTWPPESFNRQGFYNFDEINGGLEIHLFHATPSQYKRLQEEFTINNDLVLIVGNEALIKGVDDRKEGIEKMIYTIPSFSKIAFGLEFEIIYVESDGTIYLRFKTQKIVLRPKEKYEMQFKGNWKENEVAHKVIIKNHGLQDKNKIVIKYHYQSGVRPLTPEEEEYLREKN